MIASVRVGRSRQIRCLVAALATTMAAPLPILLAGTLAIQLRQDIDLTPENLGLTVTIVYLLSAVLSLIGGSMADRIGWQPAVRIAGTISVVTMLTTAAFAQSFGSFLILMLIAGFSHALAHPAGNLALATEMPIHRLGVLIGIKQTANPLGNLFAGLAVPIVGVTIGWRWAFAAGALVPLIGVAATWRLPARRATPHAISPEIPQIEEPGVATDEPVVRQQSTLALAVAGLMAGVGASALGTFAVLSAVDADIAEGTAGTYVAVAAIAGLTVRIVSGWWVDHSGSGGIRPVAVMLLVGAIGYVMLGTGIAALVLPGIVIGFGAGWGWPGIFQFGIVHYFRAAAGRATGRVQMGTLLGSVIGSLGFSLVATRFGYGTAWMACAVITLGGAAVSLYAAHDLARDHAPLISQVGASADRSPEPDETIRPEGGRR